MSQEIQEITQLQKKLTDISEKDFLQLVSEQFIKDFSRAGVMLENTPLAFKNKEELFEFAHQTYQKVLKEHTYILDSLLYLIDIPEKHLNHNFKDFKNSEMSTEIILIREAQKVYLRITYSA